ncbi:hypothetical protein J6590_083795 [Homalodisca vitripennis]|nr:hypothetical protein J6590_083795 [Homalodisca vitripennis]
MKYINSFKSKSTKAEMVRKIEERSNLEYDVAYSCALRLYPRTRRRSKCAAAINGTKGIRLFMKEHESSFNAGFCIVGYSSCSLRLL